MMSEAHFSTRKADLYANRVCKHFAHKIHTEWTPPEGVVEFPELGTCRMTARPDELVLEAEAADPGKLERVQDVITRHLERFGARDGIAVDWNTAG